MIPPSQQKVMIQDKGFPGDSVGNEPTWNADYAGDVGSIPGSGRSPRGEHGNPLKNSCLENPMATGAWESTVCGVANCWTQLKPLRMQHTYGVNGLY